MPRVLVTGGTGFLGSHLVDALTREGWDVVAADVHPPADGPDLRFVRLDVRDAAAVREVAEGCDVIINNAALVPVTRSTADEYLAVNLGGTRNVLAAARARGAYVVHISSTSLYAAAERWPITTTTPLTPIEPYGRSKLAAEQAVDDARAGGLVVSTLRPRTVVGPGRVGIFDAIFPRIQKGKLVPLFGSGANTLQLLDADDLCSAVLSAIALRANKTYILGALEYGTVREDFEQLIAYAGTGARIVGVPVAAIHAVVRPLHLIGRSPFTEWHYKTAHRSCYCDVAPIVEELGWHPQRSNVAMLCNAYDSFISRTASYGASAHNRPLDGALARLLRG